MKGWCHFGATFHFLCRTEFRIESLHPLKNAALKYTGVHRSKQNLWVRVPCPPPAQTVEITAFQRFFVCFGAIFGAIFLSNIFEMFLEAVDASVNRCV